MIPSPWFPIANKRRSANARAMFPTTLTWKRRSAAPNTTVLCASAITASARASPRTNSTGRRDVENSRSRIPPPRSRTTMITDRIVVTIITAKATTPGANESMNRVSSEP